MAKYLDENGLLYFWQKIKGTFATSGDIPTDNSELTNGADYQTGQQVESAITAKGYQTSEQVQSAINAALNGITGIDFQVVESLPSTGTTGTYSGRSRTRPAISGKRWAGPSLPMALPDMS